MQSLGLSGKAFCLCGVLRCEDVREVVVCCCICFVRLNGFAVSLFGEDHFITKEREEEMRAAIEHLRDELTGALERRRGR